MVKEFTQIGDLKKVIQNLFPESEIHFDPEWNRQTHTKFSINNYPSFVAWKNGVVHHFPVHSMELEPIAALTAEMIYHFQIGDTDRLNSYREKVYSLILQLQL